MKKLFFVTGLMILCILVTRAQSTQLGLKAGLNVSSMRVSDGNNLSARAGFHVGGLAHIHLDPNWALQPELVYSEQGGTRDNLTRKQNYINIPLLAQYMTNTGFRIETGPQVGLLVSAKNEVDKVSVDVKDQTKSADFSWALGAGYLSKSGLGVDARYNFGISNVNESSSPKVRNNVFQIGAFYQFHH